MAVAKLSEFVDKAILFFEHQMTNLDLFKLLIIYSTEGTKGNDLEGRAYAISTTLVFLNQNLSFDFRVRSGKNFKPR